MPAQNEFPGRSRYTLGILVGGARVSRTKMRCRGCGSNSTNNTERTTRLYPGRCLLLSFSSWRGETGLETKASCHLERRVDIFGRKFRVATAAVRSGPPSAPTFRTYLISPAGMVWARQVGWPFDKKQNVAETSLAELQEDFGHHAQMCGLIEETTFGPPTPSLTKKEARRAHQQQEDGGESDDMTMVGGTVGVTAANCREVLANISGLLRNSRITGLRGFAAAEAREPCWLSFVWENPADLGLGAFPTIRHTHHCLQDGQDFADDNSLLARGYELRDIQTLSEKRLPCRWSAPGRIFFEPRSSAPGRKQANNVQETRRTRERFPRMGGTRRGPVTSLVPASVRLRPRRQLVTPRLLALSRRLRLRTRLRKRLRQRPRLLLRTRGKLRPWMRPSATKAGEPSDRVPDMHWD